MTTPGPLQGFASRVGPWFLHNRNIGRFLESVGLTYDSAGASLEQGLRLSQPLRCDVSALPVLSKDRRIRLYPTEPEASQRLRLSQWKQLHRQRGTHQGELRHSQPYFLPDVPVMRIVHQDGAGGRATWHTLGSDGSYTIHKSTPSNWNYDGQTLKFSRWWFILYAPASSMNLARYDDGGVYDGGEVYDGVPLVQQALDWVAMPREWKGAHSRLQAYIVATDPASFDPAGVPTVTPDGWTTLPILGNWISSLSPSGTMTRPPTALWIYDRGVV